jgi:hypothetical protein
MASPNGNGKLGGTVSKLLSYADRPWKAAVVILCLILGGIGYLTWDLRHKLFEYWRESPTELNLGALPIVLKDIQKDTSADLIGVWSVDLKFNSEFFIVGRYADGSPWVFKPARAPLIADKTPTGLIVRLLAGHPICDEANVGVSLLVKGMAQEGMTRICLIPVPPEREEELLAMIAIGWKKPFSKDYEAAVIDGALQTSTSLWKVQGP